MNANNFEMIDFEPQDAPEHENEGEARSAPNFELVPTLDNLNK